MSSTPSENKPQELKLTDALKRSGVKSISRQGALVRISHSLEKNGKVNWTTILFEVDPDGFFATLQNFEHSCQKSKVPGQIIQQIMARLSSLDDDYYANALKYNGEDNKSGILGTSIKIGGFFEDGNDSQQESSQQDTDTSAPNPQAGDEEQNKNS